MYAKVENGAVVAFPYTYGQLRADFPQTSFRSESEVTPDDLAPFGVLPVVDDPLPAFNPLEQRLEQSLAVQADRVVRGWTLRPVTPEEYAEEVANLVGLYDAAMSDHFDAVARQRNYSGRNTAALRAGYPGPFQQEGIAFATWMDQCNLFGYQLIADVQAGRAQLPTVEAFIALLPEISWPPSPVQA